MHHVQPRAREPFDTLDRVLLLFVAEFVGDELLLFDVGDH